MSRIEHDRGLKAVARVRGVRETDSRLGLQQALAQLREREAEVAAREHELANAPGFTAGTAGDFLAARHWLEGMSARVVEARVVRDASRTIAEESRGRWQYDKSRLRAVELLLERRAEARREELHRKEAHELDDIAGQLWSRRREAAAVASGGAA